GQPIPAFIVRKEPKGHGTGAWIEGRTLIETGSAVAIGEDVVTTGASTLPAFERAEAEGLQPRPPFALVDRAEGGRARAGGEGGPAPGLSPRGGLPRVGGRPAPGAGGGGALGASLSLCSSGCGGAAWKVPRVGDRPPVAAEDARERSYQDLVAHFSDHRE